MCPWGGWWDQQTKKGFTLGSLQGYWELCCPISDDNIKSREICYKCVELRVNAGTCLTLDTICAPACFCMPSRNTSSPSKSVAQILEPIAAQFLGLVKRPRAADDVDGVLIRAALGRKVSRNSWHCPRAL